MDYLDELFTESYFGKTKSLKRIELYLTKMAKLIKEDPSKDYSNHILNKQIEKEFENQFGFKKIYLVWDRMPLMRMSGFTLTTSDILFDKHLIYLKDKKNGFYDKNHRHVAYIRMSVSIIETMDLTGEEMLGIILHEFGHNFDDSFYSRLNFIFSYTTLFAIFVNNLKEGDIKEMGKTIATAGLMTGVQSDMGNKLFGEINHKWNIFLDRFPKFKELEIRLGKLYNIYSRIDVIFKTFRYIANIPMKILLFPKTQLENLITRKGEEFADSFAAAYGYGPALARGLNKLSNSLYEVPSTKEEIDNMNIVYKIGLDFAMFRREIVTFANSDHGTEPTRVMSIKQELMKDLQNSNYPPGLKAELQRTIDELQETYDIMNNCSKGGKGFILTTMTRKFLDKVFRGRSDIINRLFRTNTVRTSMYESVEDILDMDEMLSEW